MTESVTTVGADFETLTLGDADPTVADLEDVYLDGTLVLIGCGKAKRDPNDPVDVHEAVVEPGEHIRGDLGPIGPAWEARDLYTSNYFAAKREFAETVTRWTGDETTGWAILSAKHGCIEPWQPSPYYDVSIDDLGDDPTNPDHRVRNSWGRRRPDGQEIVTEVDAWAARVAANMMRWLASYRDEGDLPWQSNASTLLVLAGQKYLDPLRERGVFEYGISRMMGDPNQVWEFPVDVRYLFENLDAGGNGDQMAWLSDAVSRLEVSDYDEAAQAEFGAWTGEERSCDRCGVPAPDADLTAVDEGVYCAECHPETCARCGAWTHDNGLGGYPLCSDCQTERGGMTKEPLNEEDTEQGTIRHSVAATDGGDQS